jgi:hypothetical protein
LTTTAVIFAPAVGHIEWASQCQTFCTAMDYEVDSVTSDWAAADAMLSKGLVDVIVVARHDHDQHRAPRIEVAADLTASTRASERHRNSSRRRRPQRL